MKKRFLTAAVAIVLMLLSAAILPSCASRNTATFEFELKDAAIKYSEVVGMHYATVTVVTTCKSGRLYDKEYPHAVEGGRPTLHHYDGRQYAGEGVYEIVVTELNMKRGDTVECRWIIEIPSDFTEGDYDICVEWFGSEQHFEGVTFLKTNE